MGRQYISKSNVLILDGDAAHALAIAECLKENGYAVALLCHEKTSYGYHASIVREKFIGPDSNDEEKYVKFLKEFLFTHKFDVLIPTSDASAKVLSKYKKELSEYSSILMPDFEIFMRAYDKNKLMSLCEEKGFPHPKTLDLSKVNLESEDIKNFPFPALIKPNLTSGARGMTLVRDYEEFLEHYSKIKKNFGHCHLQQFIASGGKQIKVQVFISPDGDTIYSSTIWKQRFYPVNGGSSCCNISTENLKYEKVCIDVLKELGWRGFADFDLIENPKTGEFLIMEINPRIPACIRSVFKSGIDYATLIADSSLGKKLKVYSYNPGKRLRHLGFDILWFLKSPERLKANPSWFKFFGKNLYYQDWVMGNFSAFLFGTIGNIKKILNPEFRKAKSGV